MTKLKNSKYDKTPNVTTQKLKMWKKLKKIKKWQVSKTQIVTKPFSLNCDKTHKQNCDKTHKLKLWEKKTRIVTKQTKKNSNKNSKTWVVTKLRNLNWDKTQLKVLKNSTTETVTEFNNSNGDKTQPLKLWQNSTIQILFFFLSDKHLLLRTTWHLDNRWDVFEAAICNLAMFFFVYIYFFLYK